MKILSFNTGYFLGYSGMPFDYFRDPLTGIRGSKTELDNIAKFVDIFNSEEPDVALTQEVDGGSMRTNTSNQHLYIKERLPEKYSSSFSTKYRGKLFPKAPILKYMGNSVFFNDGKALNHSLSIGRKNLVQEIRLGDISIFSLHLSTFGKWIRKRQIDEIAQLVKSRENYVIAGDMNLHQGRKEISYLEKKLGNKVHSPGKTFPAGKPTRKLDLVIGSENVEIQNLTDLGQQFSDHRPISFEIDY